MWALRLDAGSLGDDWVEDTPEFRFGLSSITSSSTKSITVARDSWDLKKYSCNEDVDLFP